jgi:peptidoglycan/LPS O-acetylase OafA/YrhL
VDPRRRSRTVPHTDVADDETLSSSARVPAAPARPEPGSQGRQAGGASRRDIQGLRAIAVGLVLLYHLRPGRIPGGFVGVDVFLVISGFLIVGSLAREATGSGTISLRDFYARRIRRLLPASAFVLVATTAATVLLLPLSRWQSTAEGVVASALQVQNWFLALGTGYAGATAAVSPLQHYWSLAVEEQFYLVTPWVLLAACWVASRIGRSRASCIGVAVGGVALLSLVHSVLLSASSHDVAYFATTTRMWELSVGGLLALAAPWLRLPRAVAQAAVVVGLLAIGWSALTFTTDLAFPGGVAAIPVLGSALVLLGGLPDGSSAAGPGAYSRVLGWQPFAWVGDVSYSLYLCHWPVIVVFVARVGHPPTTAQAAVLVAGCLLLAWASTRFVERPFRSPSRRVPARLNRRRAYALAAALTTASVLLAVGPWLYVDHREAALAAQTLDADHPGAAGVLPEQLPPPGDVPVIPDPAVASSDGPLVYRVDGCEYDPRAAGARPCAFGDRGGAVGIVLVGDSHAGQFSTVLDQVARRQGWRLDTMVRNGCPFTSAPLVIGGNVDGDCAAANRLTVDRIVRLHPRVVVTSAMNPVGYEAALGWTWESRKALVDGYRELWRPLVEAGSQVVVLRDPPVPDYVDPECVEQHGAGRASCGMTRAAGVEEQPDPQLEAAQGMAGVHVVDLTDHLCNRDVCPGVVGNVLVYRDNHLTDTLTLSLAPALTDALAPLV